VADGGDVLDERVVLDGEVVGGERLAQALAALEKLLKGVLKGIVSFSELRNL